MPTHVVRVQDRPDLETAIARPANPEAATRSATGTARAPKTTRYLGPPGEDFVKPTQPPFAYFIERPAGDVTPDHAHDANRTEFVVEGRIEWRERGKPPVEYGAGTLTWVPAGTIYGYTVLEDAKILILFETSPGMNYR